MPSPGFPSRQRTVLPLLAGIAILILPGCEKIAEPIPIEPTVTDSQTAEFVGGVSCAGCHAKQFQRWAGSHHDLAMQVADGTTVLGDFESATFNYNGVTTEFFQRDGSYFVRTDGADGEPAAFRVTHTFGVDPLQQYLVALPGGRLQVLSTAWDSRPASQGGQRWLHLHPDDAVDSDDPLHWTGVFLSWNTTCAGCHSTNLRKNYAVGEGTFDTTWSSIDVDCEACHGPGSLHAGNPAAAKMELAHDAENEWMFAPGASIASRSGSGHPQQEMETCAQCHSRRGQLVDEFRAGVPLLDAFRPEVLQAGLYYADGQILDEVYVYGSFLQSRMYHAGVSCSDCHDAHTAKLRYMGNAVCTQCHLQATYEVAAHHHHEAGAAGSACVDCHMPARTYMVVDPRRDHSFRVPRPDLSAELDAPNACNGCHEDRSSEWAAAVVAGWFPDGRTGTHHYGEALAAGRNWARDRGDRLAALITDSKAPAIVRATAITLLAEQIDTRALGVIGQALDSDSPLIQLAAIDAHASAPAAMRISALTPLLEHPLRALRLAAARHLVPARTELRQRQAERLQVVLQEYRQSQAFNSDRAEGLTNLAGLQMELGDIETAEASLRSVIDQHPWFAAAYINLADLYRQMGREAEALDVLARAVRESPEDPAGQFAYGLALVRSGRSSEALDAIRRTVELAPDQPYYHYVYGVALNSGDNQEKALEILRNAHDRFPGYRDLPFALAAMYRDAGDTGEALRYARELLVVSPDDPAALALIRELEQ